jgi:hypothetical protein
MGTQLELETRRMAPRSHTRGRIARFNLVRVVSNQLTDPGDQSRPVRGPIRSSRVDVAAVAASATWCCRRAREGGGRAYIQPQLGAAPDIASIPVDDPVALWELMGADVPTPMVRKQIVASITSLRNASAVIAGPMTGDDCCAPGMLAHLADLACFAYRALRPARSLVAHPGFGQVARRFDYVQLSLDEARALGAGASDIGGLSLALCRELGGRGECAITNNDGEGRLWADSHWWTITPWGAGDIDASAADDAFCVAWVVARRCFGAKAAAALRYAQRIAGDVLARSHGSRAAS